MKICWTTNKSRKLKEFKSKAETALWFVESYGLVPQCLKLESTDGQTVKVYFNPSSSKFSYQDLHEEESQKIKDLLIILDKFKFVIFGNFRKLFSTIRGSNFFIY
jgi:hypothetical protein